MNISFIFGVLIGSIIGIFLFNLIVFMINDVSNGRRDNRLVYFLYFKLGLFRPFFNKRLKHFRRTHNDWRTAELGIR